MTSERGDDDLTRAERELLEGLRTEAELPASLEERTVAALRREGLLEGARAPERSSRSWSARARWTAAAALLFVAGYWTGARGVGESAEPGSGRAYLLLLRRDHEEVVSAEEHRRRVAEYGAWARGLGERLVDGAELSDSGLELEGAPPGVAARIEPGEDGHRVAGYFLIRAGTDEEAAAIAATCPHLAYDGRIEVRRLEP